MKSFMKNWHGRSIQDDGCYMSKEASSFVIAFRNMLKRELSKDGINVIRITPNHYDLSGFVEKDGKYVYIAYSIPRYGEIVDFGSGRFCSGVLYRSASSLRDFAGGCNHFCSIYELPDMIRKFYDNERNWADIA
ncbi:hypothetical protein bpr_II109 (plasmid) [Butyrivibrio proteoclasticus B316]|uniref:Uncharacterized protein n=1 Tax=Butyrivibrio proteoclasticus (strain ATCC 51982 / DSM 14932 / B316) TaxID=515622 RepID=E0S3R6_BUTPB|nr:hypothetical protein [Butyrivibrio proteoclasticus]ADL36048.1 hypothetical protein bpr_II109 [Butyrivibrio proteoclasticus B316]